MKFSLSWLKDHLETEAAVDEIAETCTDLGLEVENVANPADRLADFVVGHVRKAEKHPDADRLRVCQVDTGGGVSQIICGAPNARKGISVVVAHPGARIPSTGATIGVGKIRGVESCGMMCSEREMGMSEEHEGIIELPGEPKAGMRFVDWLVEHDPVRIDPVIEIAVTPNRPDALGVRGIARDLAARGIGTLKPRALEPVAGTFACPIGVNIDAALKDRGCPLFAGRLIRGAKNGPSPRWLQDRLKAIGLRPISALVDITNFFAFDLNRPLHVFDADLVKGDLRIHPAEGGETLEALDDKTYRLEPGMMAISDDAGPESIAGVMGGKSTGCTEATANIFLESAYWDPVAVAAAGRRLKIVSDARYRFERGVDPAFTLPGLDAATKMILELCGGEPSEVSLDGAVPDTRRAYRLDPERVRSLVGMEIPAEEQRRALTALGFGIEDGMAHPPSWRPDVQGEADLVEEVARVASLTKLVGKCLPRPQAGVQKAILTPLQKRERQARRTCAALGYDECVTYSFIDRETAAMFGGGSDSAMLENPISSEMSHMRPQLLPELLRAASRNQARGFLDMALFEAGPAFHGGEPGEERPLVTGLLIGHYASKDPHGSRRPADVFDARADAEAVLASMGAPAKLQILRGAEGWWHPGRHGRLCLGPKMTLGVFGELHPAILREMDVKGPAMAFTLYPADIPETRTKGSTRPALDVSQFQFVERDFAFVVDADVEATTLTNAAAGADKSLISDVRVFDEFVGGALGEGRKSLAIAVRIQPRERTLTDEEIEAVCAKIVGNVEKASGGILRS